MNTEILKNVWYAVALSSDVKAGKMKSVVLDGQPIVLARKPGGEVYAIRNICPHRGIPFSYLLRRLNSICKDGKAHANRGRRRLPTRLHHGNEGLRFHRTWLLGTSFRIQKTAHLRALKFELARIKEKEKLTAPSKLYFLHRVLEFTFFFQVLRPLTFQ